MAVTPIHTGKIVQFQLRSTDTLPNTLQSPLHDGSTALVLDTGDVYIWGEGRWYKL